MISSHRGRHGGATTNAHPTASRPTRRKYASSRKRGNIPRRCAAPDSTTQPVPRLERRRRGGETKGYASVFFLRSGRWTYASVVVRQVQLAPLRAEETEVPQAPLLPGQLLVPTTPMP